MKKDGTFFLVLLTTLFIGFLLGMFVGRTLVREPVIMQNIPTEPTSDPTQGPGETVSKHVSADGKININAAPAELLDTLPGIGPVLAQRIVEHRESHGPFGSVSELSNVEGIGNGTMLKILDLITVEG